jgi:uncharacterized membrane protein YbhN (UPF0104 family)
MSLRFESDRGMPKGRIARGVRFEYKIWFNNNPGSVAYRQWMLHASPYARDSAGLHLNIHYFEDAKAATREHHLDARIAGVVAVRHCVDDRLGYYLAGQFVGNVLPSTVGGDVLRVSRAAKSTGSSDVAFASVAIERLTGFVALPLLTLIGLMIKPSLLDVPHAWISIVISLVTVGALLIILVVAGSPHLAGRFAKHQNWMRFVGAVHIGVDRMRREPARAASVLLAALAYQASVVAAVWCAVHSLGVSVPDASVLAFVPAVAMAQVLPISLSGLGIREGLLVLLLHPLGVPTGKAIGVGLLWYGMTLVVSLLGAPLFAAGYREGKDGDGDDAEGLPPDAAVAGPTITP